MKIAKKEKSEKLEKERITILVPENLKNKWQDFTKKSDYSTLSKFIREAVEFYIDYSSKPNPINTISKLSHNLKGPLTAIKGFSQLLIENYKDKLDWDVLTKIKDVFDQSLNLEGIIKNSLDDYKSEKTEYDLLIVDDDSSTNKVLIDFFQLKGYTCKDTTSGTGTLEELKFYKPRVILLDIILPDNSGYEICKRIKSDDRYKDIIVFYITAVPANEVKSKIKETMADGYFLKPFNFAEFERIFEYF